MNILSRVLLRLGYVRLKDYGYMMTAEGRIVELARVTDDRFAPPPWEPIAWQSATAFLPPESPPRPRPLPPPPDADESLSASGTVSAPETRAPVATVVAGTIVGAAHVSPPVVLAPPVVPPRTEPEDEEWEWRMALARARERAAREAGRAARPPQSAGRIPAGLASALDRLPPDAELDGANFAEGSRRHPIARSEPGDVTDVSVRSGSPAREDDETRVDDSMPIDPDALDSTVDGEPVTSIMFVPPPPPPAPAARAGEGPLPRASTRLRRTTPAQ
jgi:hypothetical protein